jgi:hypothetical protein
MTITRWIGQRTFIGDLLAALRLIELSGQAQFAGSEMLAD